MNSTDTNSSCKPYNPNQDGMIILKVVTISILSVLGTVGNILVIVLAIKFTVRKNLHYLIINMSTSDTLGNLGITIFALLGYLGFDIFNLSDGFEVILCKGLPFIQLSLVLVSIISLLIMSIERFRASRATMRSVEYSQARRVGVLIFSWAISFAAASHATVVFNIVPNSATAMLKCMVSFKNPAAFLFALVQFVLIVVIFFVMIFMNVLTLRSLSKTQEIHAHLSEDQRQMRSKRTKRIVAMILCSLVLCFLCYLPYSTLSFISSVEQELFNKCLDSNVEVTITIITNILPLLTSCLSPCIYITFLSDFKEAARRLFCRSNKPRRVIPTATNKKTTSL